MVALPQPFDARNFEPTSGYSPLPAGWYSCVIVASEIKPTKANDGQFLALDRKVIDCPDRNQVGKTFTQRLNVVNKSDQAMEIAQKDLSAICHVTGCYLLTDTNMLHNIPHRVRLEVSVNPDGKPNGNDVKEYADNQGNPPNRAGSGAAAVSPQGSHSAVAQAPAQQPAAAQPQPAPAAAAPQPAAWGGTPAPAAQAQPAAATAAPPAWGSPPPNGSGAPAAWGRPN